MRIRIINPNTNQKMTRDIHDSARSCARADTIIETVSPEKGPISIENHHDMYIAVIGMIEEVHRGVREGCDAFVIAAACDPGISAAREIADVPVIGIGEASLYMASLVAAKISIVTVLPTIRPLIEDVVQRTGMTQKCVSIRTTSLTVLACQAKPESVMEELTAESRKAIDEDQAEAICLGCSGMTGFAVELETRIGVPVFDGVVCATKLAEIMVDLGKRTSKALSYKRPKRKEYKGYDHLLPLLEECICPVG